MLDLLCGSFLYLKIYLDEQDHQNTIHERNLPYSISTEKRNPNNLRQADLQENEIMSVNIMRKSVSVWKAIFIPAKKN